MIISATIECKWCGEKTTIPTKQTTRSFNIALNKLKRIHDWRCEHTFTYEKNIKNAISVTNSAIEKMMQG